MDDGIVAFMGGLQVGEDLLPVRCTLKDGLSFIASRGNMVQGAGVLGTKRSSHTRISDVIFFVCIISFLGCEMLRPDTF